MTSIPALLHRLRSGVLTLQGYLDELETRFEQVEPEILAFVPEEGRFERLRRDAALLSDRFPDPATRPPLFGLPIGVKDIFHVDGFVTRAGSRLPPESMQGPEAECVTTLKHAGALVLGKTATTEFAYFAPGPTRNPRNPDHTPGGSSSGSAAAVAAGLCPFALGTQTIGSINRPAAFCGVVGFKPTYGRIATGGIIPLSPSLDHAGFFTADTASAELMAAHLCHGWRARPSPNRKPVLAVPVGVYLEQADPEGLAQFRSDCDRLTAAGFAIKQPDAFLDFEEIRRCHLVLMAAEAARVHAAWFEASESLYHPRTAGLIREGRACSEKDIAAARAKQIEVRSRLDRLMAEQAIDVWLSPPAKGSAPRGLESTGDPVMNLPWTNAGLPTLTLPTGSNADGLPLGLQLTGRREEDEMLFGHAQLIEQALTG